MKTKSNIIITIMLTIIFVLMGIIVYLTVDLGKENNKVKEPNNEVKNETSENDVTVEVIEEMPMIISSKPGALEVNRKIVEFAIGTEKTLTSHKTECDNHSYYVDDILDSPYCKNTVPLKGDYEIKNNIVAIYMDAEAVFWNASGSGRLTNNFFYDIKNDKELTMKEALPLMGYTVEDLKQQNVTSFEQLETDTVTYYTIENGKGKITVYYTGCSEGGCFY